MKSPSNCGTRALFIFMLGLVLLGSSGCAATRLRADFTGYESAFAETSNREMLLNLARLSQHDPTYFFKLGQISTSYRMQAALTGTGSYVPQGTNGSNVTGGGTPSLIYEKDPQFQFIPVNDDATAQLLLRPVPAQLFYALYQQGWRADQLFRLMVDRIEFRQAGHTNWEIIRNVPASDNARDYSRFLRVSALAYELQKRGYLLLRGHRGEFVPVAKSVPMKEGPAIHDVLDAQAKNLSWQKDKNGDWELGQVNITPIFVLNDPSQEKIIEDMPELGKGGIAGVTALQAMLTILKDQFTIEEDTNFTEQEDISKGSCHLVMRSLVGLMTAAAQEQEGFDQMMGANPVIDGLHFTEIVPRSEQRPLLRLVWDQEDSVIAPLIELTYGDKIYAVTDKSTPASFDEIAWNRDVFRLISQLTAQVTVDISKFPPAEILQLHSD